MNLVFLGRIGSDAGGWWIGPDGKIHRVPGWNPEAVIDLEHAVNIVRLASQLRAEDVGQRVIETVMPFVQEQMKANLGELGEGSAVLG